MEAFKPLNFGFDEEPRQKLEIETSINFDNVKKTLKKVNEEINDEAQIQPKMIEHALDPIHAVDNKETERIKAPVLVVKNLEQNSLGTKLSA